MIKIIKSILSAARSIAIAATLICTIGFMVSNRQDVVISTFPLPFVIETRLFIVMIAFFLAGLGCGLILLSKNIIKNAINNYKNNKKKPVDLQS